MITGVSNAIHRGYTLPQAYEAFAYAQARGWTRSTEDGSGSTMPSLPTPTQDDDAPNPLHGSEHLDNTWYVVYHGIRPGVYHSLYVY